MTAEIEAEVAAARADTRRLFGTFLILNEIGKGGMGAVYRAWDDRLRRVVAIKILLEPDAEAVKRFEREAQALARLRHPGVVGIHDVGCVAGRHYLAMDFVDGTPLSRLLAKGDAKLPLTRGVEIVRDVSRAVHAAHEQGIVHRDLKPHNVIVDRTGRAVVLDFGIARIRGVDSKVTKTGVTVGTPAYMAPEQADDRGLEPDARTDVYALGATLYHVLAGRPPFEGPSEVNVIAALISKDPVPPSAHNERAGGDLETICLRCLEKDPARRYATAAEVADELDRYLAGEPIQARPIGITERWLRRAKRNKAAAALALVAAFALLGLLGLAASVTLERWRSADEKRRAEREEARANAEKLVEEKRLGRAKTAAVYAERAARSLEKGRHRSAALEAAESIALVDSGPARAIHFLARQGPYRRPAVLVPPGPSAAHRVAVSADGALLAVGMADGRVLIRALPAGDDRGTVGPFPGKIEALTWRPDSHELLIASARAGVHAWAEGEPTPHAVAPLAGYDNAAWTSRGDTILAWRDGDISVFDRDGKRRRTIYGENHGIYCVAPQPGGTFVAVGFTASGLDVVDLDGTRVAQIQRPFDGAVGRLAWSADGHHLATASHDGRVRIWEADPRGSPSMGRIYPVASVANLPEDTVELAWSPVTKRLLLATNDGLARIWDMRSERVSVLELDARVAVSAVAWTPDETSAALAAADGSVILLRPGGRGEVVRAALASDFQKVDAVAATREGRLAACGRFPAALVEGSASAFRFRDGPWAGSVAWNPAGDRIALGVLSRQGATLVFDVASPDKPAFRRSEPSWATSVAWSRDGRWLAAAWGAGFAADAWALAIDEPGAPPRERVKLDAHVEGLAWRKDGMLVTGCSDGSLRVFDPASRECVKSVSVSTKGVGALAITEDGTRLALGIEKEVQLRDAVTLAPLGAVSRHLADVMSVAFDAKGELLASVAHDRTLSVHSLVPRPQLRQTLTLNGLPGRIAFKSGHVLAVPYADLVGGIELWPLDEALGTRSPEHLLAETVTETGLPLDAEVERILQEKTEKR